MRIIGILAALVLLTVTNASAAQFGGVEELTLYPSFQYFTWKEFNDGTRLLKEDGFLYGAGAAIRVNLLKAETSSLMLRGKAELFGGEVDYDGQTQPTNPQTTPPNGQIQPPSSLPVKTDVTYIGAKGEADLGW